MDDFYIFMDNYHDVSQQNASIESIADAYAIPLATMPSRHF
jgi:hypothetical protein